MARACGAWRATTRACCPTRARAPGRALARRHALVPALLDGVVPAARLEPRTHPDGLRPEGRAPPDRRHGQGQGRDPGPAAPGQLGPRRRLGHHRAGHPVHDGRRTPEAGDPLRPFRRLPRGPRHGGPAAHRRRRLRRAGPAAARRRPGLPGRRPRPVGLRRGGRVLRRDGADARRPRPARPADRRPAAAGHPLVRRLTRHAGPGAPAGRGPAVRYARREDVRHDTGAGRRLRHGDRRASGGLAHAAAPVAEGPRPGQGPGAGLRRGSGAGPRRGRVNPGPGPAGALGPGKGTL